MNIKRWETAALDKERAASLAEEYGLPFFLAMLLDIRGFHTQGQIEEVLGRGSLSDPFLMQDMGRAVERIRRAVDDFEKIAIYGDYDCDGVTATAMLYSYLQAMGADVSYYIPQRDGEGYGMNCGAVEALHSRGVRLIVTVDNGISSIEEIALAKKLGMDVVVTDHHRPHGQLPDAVAVVNPHREDDASPFRELCGAGVVLKLLIALEDGDSQQVISEYGDLAALGTIADVVPVLGENRAIVQAGLKMLRQGGRPGVDALLKKCGGRGVSAAALAFSAIPCINATGRMGDPERAVRLFTCEDESDARALAEEIVQDNKRRRQVEGEIAAQAIIAIEADPSLRQARVIVVQGVGWHHGVVGIVAARVTERYGKPCFVISLDGDEARGSGRSVEGFSLFDAVSHCAPLLKRYGGHPMAAGVTLDRDKVPAFRELLNKYACAACPDMPAQTLRLDCRLNPQALSVQLAKDLAGLEPFGSGNPQPLFGLMGMELREVQPIGGGNHLRLTAAKKGSFLRCMCFGVKPEEFPFAPGDRVDLAVTLEAGFYRGEERLEIVAKDVRPSGLDQEACVCGIRLYEKFYREEALTRDEREKLLPSRGQLAALYRLLAARKGRRAGLRGLLLELDKTGGFGLGRLLVCLDILQERRLVVCERRGEVVFAQILPTEEKVDIFASPVYQKLAGRQDG